MTKFCRDCHWARDKYASDRDWKCRSPNNAKLDPITDKPLISEVTGKFLPKVITCFDARGLSIYCGKEARWFQTTKEVLASMPRILEAVNTKLSKIALGDL